MLVMTDTITRQVLEQVKRAMEAANSARPLPHFHYVPTTGCKPSHWQNRHTTTDCRELKKALHELADKGQIDRFLKRGLRFLRRESPHSPSYGRKSVRRKSWPSSQEAMQRRRGTQQVLKTEQRPRVMVPIMVFGGKEAPRFASLYNDPLVVEMKVASAIDCLKKLTYPGHNIVLLVHPILGFGGQEVNPTGMIRLPLCFVDKLKARNVEVDFLVVDVPTAYNVILGRPTHHKRKPGLAISIQGVDRLIPWTIALIGRRDTLDLLGVSTFGLGPLALVDIVESPLAWPLKVPPPVGAAGLSSRPLRHLVPPSTFPTTAGTGSPVPLAFSAPPRPLPPERTLRPWSSLHRLDEVCGRLLGKHGSTTSSLSNRPHGLWCGDRLPDECRGGLDWSSLVSPGWVGVDVVASSGRLLVR
ncbi:LOW QUALITY PROTEIN: hypothetical protein Cgig2_015678 [Carnegiea gigantea]|uniref:Uncharacterized protein n=1 Tax=Carnegiea gigantea TaxID=171969 RepID=A0A9Q1JUE8_9CARY|nr:LOW QUALITY PROTEIN: hypothetical protein Cgig2_015678 [Carnegiea gigantea]